jgi:ligand-binding sensor domain-containing protein
MIVKKTIPLILFLFAFATGFAQQDGAYNRAEEEKWLPKHFIHDIFQDSKGCMWIGTNEGLYKS